MNRKSAILNDLEVKLLSVKNKQNYTDLISNLYVFGAGIFLLTAVLLVLEVLFEFSRTGRTVLSILFLLLFAYGAWMIVRSILKLTGTIPSYIENEIAKRIGKFFPFIKDRLLNALQLSNDYSKASKVYSPKLIDESLSVFSSEIKDLDFTVSVDTSHLPEHRLRLIVSVCILPVLFFIFPGSFNGAAYRLVHFMQDLKSPAKYTFEVSPGNKEIVKGSDAFVEIKVIELIRPISKPPSELTILRRQEGEDNYDEIRLSPDSGSLYHATFQAVRLTTEYFARFSGVESEHYTLNVMDRPLIRSFHVKLDYPQYTRIPARSQDDFAGDITASAGTKITLTGTASKPLKDGAVKFGSNKTLPLEVRGERFSANFVPLAEDSYTISINDQEGLSNSDPVRYQLKPVEDEYPVISIIEPGRNIDIAGDKSINLLLQAKDDFGFSGMRLCYRLVKSRYEQEQKEYSYAHIAIPSATAGQCEVNYTWYLSGLDLVPEDVVEYCAEVFDNDALNGPKSGRSSVYFLRLPSLEEVFSDVDKEHERSLEDLKKSLEEAKILKENMESINRDLKKNKDPDWQTQKKMEEMGKNYQDVQKKLDEVRSRLEQMTKQAEDQNVLSKETLEKYLELQQLFQKLDSDELQDMLKQMQQKMPNISKEQLRQAMQKMTFSEELFRQSIERTINLLKRIQIEQKIDEVKKRAQELTDAEKKLQEESSKTSGDRQKQDELAKKQDELTKKEQTMEHEAADLKRRMEEFFTEMPADKMQKSLEQLQQQRVNEKMQRASRQMQTGNMQQAQQTQQQIEKDLQEFGEQMDAMQQQMLQQQSQYVINELRKATNDILEISKDEEALKQKSQNAPSNSPQLRQNAQEQQQAAQDLNNVIKGLGELSQKSFAVTPEMSKAIGEALTRMNNAMNYLDMRNGSAASREQAEAMAALNRAAMQVQNALQSMMQGGGSGAGSLIQQLRMMAGRQMSLNTQTQEMGGMSSQQAERTARLAQEQAAIQKSLEELDREARESDGKQKTLGDLQKIADEMKEVVKNLEQNNVNNETLKKQERILSRLLDASRSMQERDYEKKRKAEAGTQMTRKGPSDIDLNSLENRDRLREELLKAMEQGYSRDYQELIRKYFEELEKKKENIQ